ncbi:MAG: NADH-quinone oxidoreductase subunit L [Syntrophomonadaceae bacterium]|nr:NADH-quinone oxidoreductase subunit L [Syntrophomonadaceae bacterium]
MLEFSLHNAWLIPLLPLLAFALIGLAMHRWPSVSAMISILSIGISMLLSALVAVLVFSLSPGEIYEASVRWLSMPGLQVNMGMLVDPLAAVMLVVVTGVAFLVQVYSLGYMKGDPGIASYFGYQSLFAASMLGLVLANNFGQIFVFWELVGVCSYFLIGFWFGKYSARDAAIKAFVTNRVGDFGFLLGILFLQIVFGTLNFQELSAAIPGYTNAAVLLPIAVLLFFGPVGKSAQFPLHVWLPDAMEGPTPVSALIHAATMVAAGVYLVARAFFIFNAIPQAMTLIAIVGGLTALFAASIAIAQNDIKRILAYSTLSQLGYMMMALGVGAMTAGVFHLMTHAFFKSLLFLGAGSVIIGMHEEQDIWKMGNIAPKMPVTTWTFIIGALALAGIPPLSGFWSKDEILLGAYASGHTGLYILGVLVAFLTAFYMFRLVFVAFFGKNTAGRDKAHESPAVMTIPLLVLAVAAVLAGLVNSPLMHHVFGHFINAPGAIQPHPNTAIIVFSTLAALSGILLAWLIYQREVIKAEVIKEKFSMAYKVLYNKYYIDEIYGWLGVRLVDGAARVLFWFDIHVINGFVNLTAWFTGKSGETLRYTEDGQVQTYAIYMFAGVVIVLITALCGVFTALA